MKVGYSHFRIKYAKAVSLLILGCTDATSSDKCPVPSNIMFFPLRNLLVNLGLFAAGVWVARNLSDFDLMSPQPVT